MDQRGAKSETKSEMSIRGQWLGRIVMGGVLVIALLLGLWFGLEQPHFWQLTQHTTLEANTPTPQAQAYTTTQSTPVTSTLAPTPTVSLLPMPEPRRVSNSPTTFVSRELITTTLAVPMQAWSGGTAQSVALSADGRTIAFTAATDDGYDNLYLYDSKQENGDALTLVTMATTGASSNGWVGAPAMVPDARYMAFYAWASNLVAGDTNAVQDLFFYDHETTAISRISVGPNGEQANDRSGDSSGNNAPAISADGRYIAFHSAASNLVSGDRNGRVDVFLHDRESASTTLISNGPNGVGGNGDSSHPTLSVDGRYVLFQSRATNLDPTVPTLQSPGSSQIYLHDRTSGSTTLISRGPDGRPGDGDSTAPTLSGDGRYLAYASRATNLVAGDSNQVADVFLHDRTTGETRRVSVSSTGIQANRAAGSPQITLDGRYILFTADASNLVSGDGNNATDLFLHDQLARHTSRVSVAVTGAWTGVEGNGPTRGPAMVIPGGRLIAFISQATNLVNPASVGVPGLYLHERVDAPTFAISGRITEGEGQPVGGVVVAAGPHRTVTDANGNFNFSALMGGTYTLAAAKSGYTFSPPRRIVSLLDNLGGQDFAASAGNSPDAFIDLPLPYDGTAATLLALLRDTDEGGWIDAWFDHDLPNYTKNEAVLLWDGRVRTQDAYNQTVGCFERRCYDGHDGIDFPYRDPDPSTPNIFEPILIRPAAPGNVAAVVNHCEAGDRWCNGGYGNEVVLWHGNGYFTRYSHMATVNVSQIGQRMTPDLALGVMGSTGNSFGTHLHLAVHVDRGRVGVWDGDKVDLPVDPFGWAASEPDPWAVTAAAPISRWLWRFNPTTEAILLGSEGATLRDNAGNVTVQIPAGALAGQVRVELVAGAATAPPVNPQRSLGRGFRLQVLDWLQGGNVSNATPARPVEISLSFANAATRHLDLEQLLLYHWQAGQGWLPLPTLVDRESQAVIAASNQLGDFDLQAPLLCPADAMEPDDSFDAATIATDANSQWERLFDIAEDEDWFQIEAIADTSYRLVAEALAPGVNFTVELYDRDGLTRLNSRGPGNYVWSASETGSYFVRVAPVAGSAIGCDAGYRLSISTIGN